MQKINRRKIKGGKKDQEVKKRAMNTIFEKDYGGKLKRKYSNLKNLQR